MVCKPRAVGLNGQRATRDIGVYDAMRLIVERQLAIADVANALNEIVDIDQFSRAGGGVANIIIRGRASHHDRPAARKRDG